MSEGAMFMAWLFSSVVSGMVAAGSVRYRGGDVMAAITVGMLMWLWPFWVGALVLFSPFFLGVWVADRMRK